MLICQQQRIQLVHKAFFAQADEGPNQQKKFVKQEQKYEET